MRPYALELPAMIYDLAWSGGALAVLGYQRIDWVDWVEDELRVVDSATIGDGLPATELVVLDDGRLLARQRDTTTPWVGRRGGAFDRAGIAGDAFLHGVCATATGFVGWNMERAVVDVGGERRELELPWPNLGGVRWGDRVVLASNSALQVIDRAGALGARVAFESTTLPVVCGDWLVVGDADGTALLDDSLTEVQRIKEGGRMIGWGDRVLLLGETAVWCWRPGERSWRLDGRALQPPIVIGDRVVIGSWDERRAQIVARDGTPEADLVLPGTLRAACALGDGIALLDMVDSAVRWWRPGGAGIVELPHDFSPIALGALPMGIAASDRNALFVWRLDRDGPEWSAPSGLPPLATRIVAGSDVVTLAAHGRFASRGLRPDGVAVRVDHRARWRPAIDSAAARRIVDRMLERRVDGATAAAAAEPLAARPPEEVAPLHAAALFAPTTLDEAARHAASDHRATFFLELGAALGVSGRVLLAAVKARVFPLVPPRPVPGFEYLGSFASDGDLIVCDPCYLGQRSRGEVGLSRSVTALDGLWHTFVRPGVGEDVGRTAELVVIHGDGFATAATEPLAIIGVDAGMVGVFDKRCPKPEPPYDEGVFAARGAIASSGYGDGGYPVYGGYVRRTLAKIRIHCLGPSAPDIDTTLTKAGAVRRYSAKERFEVGEALAHPTFGEGRVVKLLADGKLEVAFGDDRRVLVHARR